MAQKFVTLPAGTSRSSQYMAAPIIDQNNLVVGLTASGGDTYPLATFATDPLTGVVAGLVGPNGGVDFSNPVKRFRDSISSALIKNMVANQPLIAPSAWTISTAYVSGQSVTNGGNAYVCISSGTSAGAGGPTTTVAGLIVDNTASWFYAGPAFTSDANAPTLGAVTVTPLGGLFYTNTACTYAPGSSQIKDDSNFTVSGGAISPSGGNSNLRMANSTAGSPNGLLMSVEFMCDAKQFQVAMGQAGINGVTIHVDQNDGNGMRPLTLGYSGLNSGAGPCFYPITWANGKPRHYRVEIGAGLANYGFLGVLLNDNTGKVWAPTNPNRYRMALVGDSWFQSATTYPVTGSLTIASQVAKIIGCTDFVINGEGGSGFVAAGTGSAFGSTQRVAFLASMAPDIVFIEGGINDSGTALASEQAAVLTYLQAVRAALPNALIFISGSNANNSGPSANIFTIEQAISNAVTAFGDPRTFFYPFSATTTAKAWISGTGTTAAPAANGNCDLFIAADQHPTYQGAAYVAYRHANAIRAIANGSLL